MDAGGIGSGGIDGSIAGTGGVTLDGGATGGAGSGGTGGAGGIATGGSGGAAGGAGGSGGGSGGVVQSGGRSGSGGTIGSGGSSAASCPQVAPADGAGCDSGKDGPCYCEDCSGSGRTIAECASGSWQVSNGPCTPITCYDYRYAWSHDDAVPSVACPAGQVCLAVFGKAPTCVTHTCGTGPVTWQCVPGANPGTSGWCWFRDSSITAGIIVQCCPNGGTSC